MQIGIVGLPFSGKTTLFQTISHHVDDSPAASRRAIVKVPDPRLDRLTDMFRPKSTVFASIEFVDVAGLQKGESGSTQFTTNFLAAVKTNDALVQVVRLFENDAVPHAEGSVDMLRDTSAFETEFIISDMTIIETRLERIQKQVLKTGDENAKREIPTLEKCIAILQKEIPLRETEFTPAELFILKTYQLLSIKPMLIALNLDESQRDRKESYVASVLQAKGGRNTKAMAFFGKIEMEMSELGPDDSRAFMAEYGITESALDSLIRVSYDLLGLQSFFTVGEDECRAWTIKKGMTAQEAAGAIHSDFVNKFIRAEVVHYDDYIRTGSFAKAKDEGVWRLEGKEYRVKEGDIMSIRHS